jgi:hypothetical protein
VPAQDLTVVAEGDAPGGARWYLKAGGSADDYYTLLQTVHPDGRRDIERCDMLLPTVDDTGLGVTFFACLLPWTTGIVSLQGWTPTAASCRLDGEGPRTPLTRQAGPLTLDRARQLRVTSRAAAAAVVSHLCLLRPVTYGMINALPPGRPPPCAACRRPTAKAAASR